MIIELVYHRVARFNYVTERKGGSSADYYWDSSIKKSLKSFEENSFIGYLAIKA